MDSLQKIDSIQLYKFWRMFALSLCTLIGVMMLTKMFSPILSPLWGILAAGVLYGALVNHKSIGGMCSLVPYGTFLILIIYSFVTIIFTLISVLHLGRVPEELSLTRGTAFVPSLLMLPIGFLVYSYIGLRRNKLGICRSCKTRNGDTMDTSRMSRIISSESKVQIRNLVILFGLMGSIVWGYYEVYYVNINVNARDWYIFTWLVATAFLVDVVYFIYRYYNLYLDYKETGDVITPDALYHPTVKTYLRYYVICDNYVYCDVHAVDPDAPYREVIDTPFFTKRNVNGVSHKEVKDIIAKMTGVEDGELRFFYGRRSGEASVQNLLRYFYFLNGTPEDHPHLRTEGEWVNYDLVKQIYSQAPERLARLSVIDTTRLATIIITSKLYNNKGVRKIKIKRYQPSFSLHDVRNSNLDFQSDEWIKISLFNSDTRFFKIKKWWRGLIGKAY